MSLFSHYSLCETLDCQSLKDQAHFTDGETEAEDDTESCSVSDSPDQPPWPHIQDPLLEERV